MNGKQRLEALGFELTLSTEFSDIFEKRNDWGDKTSVVFDKKSLEILFDQTSNGVNTAWFMPNDFYVAIFKHCADLGW
jgi:hypothetical protein